MAPLAFKGLPHRVETVAEIDGVLYVDDSKGHQCRRHAGRHRGMGRKVAIVLGGDGKGQDFSPLKPALAMAAPSLIGRDAAAIGMAIEGRACRPCIVGDMDSAVRWLAGQAEVGDCRAVAGLRQLDMYPSNYAHRAQAFIDAVQGLQP